MHPELKELLHEWRSDKSHISRIQLLSLWCHSTSLPGVFVKTFFFQIDMIRPAVRSCCTSVLNSGMQWMTRRIFTELFASDPSQPELAPLQNYLRCHVQNPQRVTVITGCRRYLIQPRFLDSSLWDYSTAPEGPFYMNDMWISGCLERRGVEKYVIPASNMMRTAIRQLGIMMLHDVPNGRRHNNKTDKTAEFFSSSWNIFTSR